MRQQLPLSTKEKETGKKKKVLVQLYTPHTHSFGILGHEPGLGKTIKVNI